MRYYQMMGKRPQDIPLPDEAVYIDPTNVSGGRDGSIENPYNSFTESGFTSGNVYRLKAGTEIVLSSELNFSGHTATFVGRYGDGDDPKIKSTVTGTCAIRFAGSTLCVLDHVEGYTDLSNSLITFIQMGTNTQFDGGTSNVISNCFIHHVKQGTADGGMGIRGGGTSLSFINTKIEDCGCDGMYMRTTPSILIDGCEIRRINQNYAGAAIGFNNLGNGASGDGIQLDGIWSNYIIRNTIVDRSDAYTGNKYCIIVNHAEEYGNNDSGIIENCTFSTNSNVSAAVHIEFGNQSIIRYNWFNGVMDGIRLGGVYCVGIKIHHNIFVGCEDGIGVGTSYSGAGYDFTGPATLTEIYNNVFYNVRRYHTWHDNAAASCDFKNNIHLRTTDSGVAIYTYGAANNWTKSNNCYGDAATAGTPGTGTNPQIGDPGFVDAANKDFHLQLTSICRNAGIDVNIDEDLDGVAIPQETNPAIGAFEYVAP